MALKSFLFIVLVCVSVQAAELDQVSKNKNKIMIGPALGEKFQMGDRVCVLGRAGKKYCGKVVEKKENKYVAQMDEIVEGLERGDRVQLEKRDSSREAYSKDYAYSQVGGGMGFLIEYGDLKNAFGFTTSAGVVSSGGWGGELFFGLLPNQSNDSIENRTIAADSKFLGFAPTHTFRFNNLGLRVGLGLGYLVVSRAYFTQLGSVAESLNRWSLVPSLGLDVDLTQQFYAQLECRAVFTLTNQKHVDEPRIILPTVGFGYRF